MQEEKSFYPPHEAAKILGITVDVLRQWRWRGRIQGTVIGNSTVYTPEQIKAADKTPGQRGRKPRTKKEGSQNNSGDAHVEKPAAA